MPLTVAIVGRPNVGKSTLFNRLAGKRLAIVDDTPGVTRDRAFAPASLAGLQLVLIDTAGFEKGEKESLTERMIEQTKLAIDEADVLIFLVDARDGVTPADEIVAEVLRKSRKPVVLVANKSESNAAAAAGQAEAYRLGFGDPVTLSAEHGIGMSDLRDALLEYAPEQQEGGSERGFYEDDDEDTDAEDYNYRDKPLRLAIVGRPNVGKSSILNRLLGEERSLVSPMAGTTRDAVLAEWQYDERDILLHDTAGLRKKARVTERLEKMSTDSTINAVKFADCVVVVLDATQALEKQDLVIADLISREGRAIVFAVNKWDLVEDRKGAFAELRERVDHLLPQVTGAPLVGMSALTGEGISRLMPAVMEADRIWNTRISTSQLNRFVEDALARHPPPAVSGRRVRIRYMTQAKARPPTFVMFGNQLDHLPESYIRYIGHALRKFFEMPGVPVRFLMRGTKNPYDDKGE